MSRYAPTHNNGTVNQSLAICSTLQNESKFRESATNHQMYTKLCAARFTPGSGILEKTLLILAPKEGEPGAEEGRANIQEFLSEQRSKLEQESLKSLAAIQEAEAFASALKQVKQHVLAQADQQQDENNSNNNDDNPDELGTILRNFMNTELEKLKEEASPLDNEAHYEICQLLGLDTTKPKKRKANGEEKDDDDIEVDFTATATATQRSTTCPYSHRPMVDAVKSTVCGHVFSRQGISEMIQQGKGKRCRCPIIGCINANITMEQMERDVEMEALARRAMQTNQRRQATQHTEELVDTDEEE